MTKKEAYNIVLKDLKRGIVCKNKDYSLGCYSCDLLHTYRALLSVYGMEIDSLPTKKKKI